MASGGCRSFGCSRGWVGVKRFFRNAVERVGVWKVGDGGFEMLRMIGGGRERDRMGRSKSEMQKRKIASDGWILSFG